MANEFLSNEEVESLLKGVDEHGGAEPPGDATSAPTAVQPYRFGSTDMASRAELPGLGAVAERLAVALRSRLFELVRRNPQVAIRAPRTMGYGEFAGPITPPESACSVAIAPLRGNAVVVLEPTLVSAVVDALFGGGGRLPCSADARAFSRTELHVMQRLQTITLDACRVAWEPVQALAFEPVARRGAAEPSTLLPSDERVLVVSLQIDIGALGGAMHVCIPHATLAPLRSALSGRAHPALPAPDSRWSDVLRREVQALDVEVCARFTGSSVALRELLRLHAGDVLSLEVSDTVTASVDGVPLFECSYGVRNGRYALRVERVRMPERNLSLGDQHG